MKRSNKVRVSTGRADEPASARPGGNATVDELLRLAVNVGGIGIYETDFERSQTRFSPVLCAILGLPVGTEMSFARASQLFDRRDRAAVQASLEFASKAGDRGKWSGVHRIVRADGAVRWVSIQGQRVYRETRNGLQPVRSIGTVVDITHLKETDAALRESELRLRLALDAAQMGTFEADMAASQARIDAQEARLLGLPEDTRVISVDELRKRVPFEDLEASDVKQRRLTEEGEAYHHEFRFRLPDGSERWLSAHADVRSSRIFGVNFDITDRKRAEAVLRESEARLRVATSGAALGVFEWDARTDRAVWENDRIYEIFGRSRADGPLSKQQFVDGYLHPGDAIAFEAALTKAICTGSNFHTVCRIRQKDRSRRWLQIDGKFEMDATGEARRLIGVVADITARKTSERKAQRLSRRLATIQEEERRRITQELHDSTVQHIVAASLTLMRLRPKAPSQGEEEERLWNDVDTSLDEAAKELRTLSYLMHPPALSNRTLSSALQQYLDGFGSRSRLDIRLRSNSKVDSLPLPMQRSLFRIVQEALANVHKHATASHVSVELRWIGQRVHLIISDDGRGMKGAAAFRRGVGLRGIRARLKELGDDFRIIRTKKQGTRMHAVLTVSDASSGRI
jgi:PAS domain S-box-containing protein